jgi:tetratricopeptide (TPR) repeat protein
MLSVHREDESRSHLLEALPIQREAGDWVGVSRTTAALGRLESNIGRMAQAELYFRDALETYRDQPVPGHLSWVICSRSEVYCRWGRLDKAESLARDAISLTNVRGTPGERAVADFNMGMVMLESGKLEAAHSHIDKARRSVDQLGFRRFLGDVLMGLGCVYFDGGDLVMAEATWDQAVPVYEETGNRKAAGFVEGMRGMVALVRGDLGQAVEHLEGVIGLEVLERRSRLLFQFALAIVYADQGRDSSAHEQLEAALKMDPGNQIDVAATRSLAERLDAWLASGRPPEAMDALEQQIAGCRAPAGADLCAAAGCSTDLRWLIAAMEQHLIGAQGG